MLIGELAARTGLSRDTGRFYEKLGLVTSRRLPSGYRDFAPETVVWLQYVRTAQALSALFAEKIRVVDARMAELTALRAELTARVGTGCPLRAGG